MQTRSASKPSTVVCNLSTINVIVIFSNQMLHISLQTILLACFSADKSLAICAVHLSVNSAKSIVAMKGDPGMC